MNLSQIRGRIKNQLSHTPIPSPAITGYLDSIINDAYEAIWTARPYTFNIKEMDKRYYEDFTPSATQSLDFTLGSRNVALDFALPERTDADNRDRFIGAVLKGPGGVYYTIENIFENGTGTNHFVLDRVFEGPTVANTVSYSIAQKFQYLPNDVIEIMDITFPNFPINHGHRGKVQGIPRRTEGAISFNWLNTASRPNYYCAYSKEHMDIIPNGLAFSTTPGIGLVDDTYYFAVSAVDHTGADSGMLDVRGIDVTGTEAIEIRLQTPLALTDEGAKNRFRIYYALQRPNQDGYKFYEIGTLYEYGAGFASSLTFNLTTLRDIKAGNYQDKVWKEANGSKKIQFYPRPTTVDANISLGSVDNELSFFHLRYLYKPAKLVDDYDSPLIPTEFHRCIIHKALVDAHSKFGNDSAALVEERKFNEAMKKLNARYASEKDTLLVRSQSMAYGRKFGRNQYIPTVTYEG